VEHKLSYGNLHGHYLNIFEGLLGDFLLAEGCTFGSFQAQCQDALDDKYVALFDAHEHHGFVDALLASMDYSRFFALMVKECRRQEAERATGARRK